MDKQYIGLTTDIVPFEQTQITSNFNSNKYIKMRLRVCHDGINRKGLNIPLNAIVQAKNSIANIPVLAHVIEDDFGNPVLGNHGMHLEMANNKPRLIHDEVPIGIVPESCNYSIEEYEGRYYVYVDAYIWRTYANYAADILDAHTQVPISAELSIVDWSDADDTGIRTINAFTYTGITLLGDDVTPGMEHAAGFIECCSADMRQRYADMCNELNALLSGDGMTGQNEKEDSAVKKQTEETVETTESVETDTTQEKEIDKSPAPADETQIEETTTEELETTEQSPVITDAITEDSVPETTEAEPDDALKDVLCSMAVEAAKELTDYVLCSFDSTTRKAIFISKENGNCYSARLTPMAGGKGVFNGDDFKRQTITFADAEDQAPVDDIAAQNFKALLTAADQTATFSAEVEELRAFKAKAETDKRVAEIQLAASEFSDLSDIQEYQTLLSEAASMPDVETFKEKCYAIRGKNYKALQAQVETDHVSGLRIPFSLFDAEPEAEPTDALGRLAKHYSNQ